MRRCPICGSGFEKEALFCPFDGCSLVTSEQRGRLGGTKIDERYFIEQRIGAGGLGEVYRARHIKMGRSFALKILHLAARDDETHARRFDLEARVLSRLHHPYCVEVTDYGRSDHGPYIVMELVEGYPLSRYTKGDGMPLGQSVELMIRVLQGLEHAHSQGIIHRDLKPDNIMLTSSPTDEQEGLIPKILDFGLAKLQAGYVEAGDVTALTAPGKVVGTPAYLAPERVVAAQGGAAIDHSVDLYAAGVILYELCCGRRPFVSDDLAAIVRHHLLSVPPPPRALWPALPSSLEAVILCAMAKKPAERFASASVFREALEGTLPLPVELQKQTPPLACHPTSTVSTTEPPMPHAIIDPASETKAVVPPTIKARQRRELALVGAIAAALLLIGLLIWALI